MALAALPGAPFAVIGPGFNANLTNPGSSIFTLDAVPESVAFIGQICTSDGGSHTIDTTGSSSIGWRTNTVTFADVGTTIKVGIAAVDIVTGPPGRAVNSADVITFDVSKTLTGGGGGITGAAWQTHVPDTGTKTIAHGDLIAICIQMTTRGGTDSILVTHGSNAVAMNRPLVVTFAAASYGVVAGLPDAVITFSDGAIGWIQGSDIFSTQASRLFNSASGTKEYGQLYDFPFPYMLYGFYGWTDPDGDFDVVMYSDPLGTPVAQKTVSIDANTVGIATSRRFSVEFTSPYLVAANQKIGAVYKPAASNITVYYRTLANATHRICDVWGTSGYGISRASGAFANDSSSLNHYYIGLIVGAFDAGGAAGRIVRINDMSLVA